jgi:hypothetical protein
MACGRLHEKDAKDNPIRHDEVPPFSGKGKINGRVGKGKRKKGRKKSGRM